jgi:hypothetical protein
MPLACPQTSYDSARLVGARGAQGVRGGKKLRPCRRGAHWQGSIRSNTGCHSIKSPYEPLCHLRAMIFIKTRGGFWWAACVRSLPRTMQRDGKESRVREERMSAHVKNELRFASITPTLRQ